MAKPPTGRRPRRGGGEGRWRVPPSRAGYGRARVKTWEQPEGEDLMFIRACVPFWVGVVLLTLAPSILQGAPPADARAAAHFEKRIRPLLLDRCLKCHG